MTAFPVLLLLPDGAAAQSREASSGWSVQVTPYLWAAGLEGRVRADPRLPALRTSLSFGEVLDDLDAGLFVNALARRDRVVVMADLSYVDTSRKGSFEALPVLGGRASVRQVSGTLAVGYRVLAGEGLDLDLLAGLRAWRIDAAAEVRVAGAPFASASTDLSWVDPILGIRLRADLAPRLSALAMADVGGFGIGARGTFQGTAVLNWQLGPQLYASAGYRHLVADYREGGRVLDLTLSGPVLGVTWRF